MQPDEPLFDLLKYFAINNGFRWNAWQDAMHDTDFFQLRRGNKQWGYGFSRYLLVDVPAEKLFIEFVKSIPTELWLEPAQPVSNTSSVAYTSTGSGVMYVGEQSIEIHTLDGDTSYITAGSGTGFQTGGTVTSSGTNGSVSNESPSIDLLQDKFDLNQKVPVCPQQECSVPRHHLTLKWTIIHLNDAHQWTRKAIADWLESADLNINLKETE